MKILLNLLIVKLRYDDGPSFSPIRYIHDLPFTLEELRGGITAFIGYLMRLRVLAALEKYQMESVGRQFVFAIKQ